MAEEQKDERRYSEESVKLFVGQVPKNMMEAELLAMFKDFALIDEVNIIKDQVNKASRVSEEGNKSATLIVTARKFSVIWNFDQVKNTGHECYRNQQGMESCYCYKIVLKDESIVDICFMQEKFAVNDTPEAPLVVATPVKVTSFSISTRQ